MIAIVAERRLEEGIHPGERFHRAEPSNREEGLAGVEIDSCAIVIAHVFAECD